MKNLSPKSTFSFLSIICSTVGHDYTVTRKVTNHINEYKCTHCGREVADSDSGQLEELTNKLRQANTCLAMFFQKKMRRISA